MNISKKVLTLFWAALMAVCFIACSSAEEAEKIPADLVVYGKIFTSEGNGIVEAFAVKDGRYVYVGDKKGAEAFVEAGKTEVIDYTGKGLVMPGCGNGHAHYLSAFAVETFGTMIDIDDTVEKFLTEIVPATVKQARDTGAKVVYGMGWEYQTFKHNMPTRQQLDAICSDIPMYFADEENHKCLVNTLALVNAGIMSSDGTVLIKEVRGGEITMGADGTPTGLLKEQASTYVRSFLDNESLFPVETAKATMAKIQELILSEGYTMYLDGYSSYFFNDVYYQAARQMEKAGNLHFVLGFSYEMDSWMNVDAVLKKAIAAKKFASQRVKPYWIKMFMDGTVESGTGFIEPVYLDGHQGIVNWTEEELTDITKKANADGLIMHIHALGNKAVNRVVNAYINGGKPEMRNTIVHLRNVDEPDYQRMADNNIYVTSGMIWHHETNERREETAATLPEGLKYKGYPMKSFFDHGIPVSFHTDYPALSDSPDDPFGVMEIALTGVSYIKPGDPWWPEEFVTREQALTALTINCAKQMLIEDERGSISTGKYADFLLLNKDVLTCPVMEIHTAKPQATYFEGKKVFAAASSSKTLDEVKAEIRAQYGENKQITDGNYDQSLAVKCINGTFVGKKTDGVIAYKGIPFVGRQPVGNLRWKAPVDFLPDDGVYEAYYNGKTPTQCEDTYEAASLYVQGEDCLYLNVWKPDEASAEKKPVMVWIHGGAFEYGGTADPVYELHNFVKENPDVIAVSIAYRVGVFGFFHLSHLADGKDYPDAQNLGLMDQMMALKWIHENIAAFGGDPDNVTIFGESAGGESVTVLPLIEGSHKYFKRVIAQSGSPLLSRSTEQCIETTNEVMKILGCKNIAELQKVDVNTMVEAMDSLGGMCVGPERDGKYLTLTPYEDYAKGAAKDIDILQGCNKDEMNYFMVDEGGAEPFLEWINQRWAKNSTQLTDEEKALVESFCKDVKGESYEPICRLYNQAWFIAPLFRLSENQTKAGGKSYTYYFTVESSIPLMKSGHAVEIAPVLNRPEITQVTGRAFDETFSKTMRKMWVQFAKTGNPSLSADISPDGKTHTWPLYDSGNKSIMVLDEFDIHPAKESELKLVDWERCYFLTKYYCL